MRAADGGDLEPAAGRRGPVDRDVRGRDGAGPPSQHGLANLREDAGQVVHRGGAHLAGHQTELLALERE